MVEEIREDLYRIRVPLPDNPLKELNSYFIRGDESDLLIDTGFRLPACLDALQAGLKELGSEKKRRRVLCTHLHSDHTGLADLVAGEGLPIYLSETDLHYMRMFQEGTSQANRDKRFLEEGFPKEVIRKIFGTAQSAPTTRPEDKDDDSADFTSAPELDERMTPLMEGDVIEAGRYRLETISTPGHTPGNSMFWMAEQNIMLTGDHILFDITPNIAYWFGREDSLGDYIASLRKVRGYPVQLSLPGHREPGDYHARIEELLEHHERRLDEVLRIVRKAPGISAYEIAQQMRWKIHANNWESSPVTMRWFAMGECLAHLDHLLSRRAVRREKTSAVCTWYAGTS